MKLLEPLLRSLSPIYAAAVGRKNRSFDEDRRIVRALRWPVVSIGSVSAGGAGKTPFLIALAELLRQHGFTPDVLSRGYGRTTRGVLQVQPEGSAADYGDEPLLLARRLGCPVFVGADRHAAGMLAERSLIPLPKRVHLLDDGFSHRQLARTVEIALVTAADLNDRLLPAGRLREPLAALRRAHILVIRERGQEQLRRGLDQLLGANHGKPIWTIRRTIAVPSPPPRRAVVFSAIARPEDFERAVRRAGVSATEVQRFRDHHRYTQRDAEGLRALALLHGADAFVLTEKDEVKITSSLRATLESAAPIQAATLGVELLDAGPGIADLVSRLTPS